MRHSVVSTLLALGVGLTAACETLPSELQSFQGEFRYTAFDSSGAEIVQGSLVLDVRKDSTIVGEWHFTGTTSDSAIYHVHHVGSGTLEGSVGPNGVWLNLDPGYADANLFLTGHAADSAVTGTWMFSTIIGPTGRGTFRAEPN